MLLILSVFKYLTKFISNLSSRTHSLGIVSEMRPPLNGPQNMKTYLMIYLKPDLRTKNSVCYYSKGRCEDGLGYVVLQNGYPVSFASRSLKKYEQMCTNRISAASHYFCLCKISLLYLRSAMFTTKESQAFGSSSKTGHRFGNGEALTNALVSAELS